jgi:hypothetical protein
MTKPLSLVNSEGAYKHYIGELFNNLKILKTLEIEI